MSHDNIRSLHCSQFFVLQSPRSTSVAEGDVDRLNFLLDNLQNGGGVIGGAGIHGDPPEGGWVAGCLSASPALESDCLAAAAAAMRPSIDNRREPVQVCVRTVVSRLAL